MRLLTSQRRVLRSRLDRLTFDQAPARRDRLGLSDLDPELPVAGEFSEGRAGLSGYLQGGRCEHGSADRQGGGEGVGIKQK